jgi:uncharacterized protein (TIGR03083 family)
MIPTDTIAKLDATWISLSALGASLSEEEWKTPTDLPGWTVQDNLSHLVGIERMMEGLPAVDHEPPAADYVHNPIGQMNEREVDARRHLRGAEVLAEWDDVIAARRATLAAGDEAYFAQDAMTPTGPGTLADFLHIRVLDCWVHEQDMRRATQRPGHLDGPVAEHTIDRLIRTLPIVVGKRAATPEGATVVVELTGPVQRTLPITVIGGRATFVDRVPVPVLATLRLDSEAFVILATGRCTANDLSDRWIVEGDSSIGIGVASQLNMMI